MADPESDIISSNTPDNINLTPSPTSNPITQADPESNIHPAEDEDEEDDQIQDYRFLNNLTKDKTKQSLLPRRGEKDFEPHGTIAQSSTLAASQAAMHEALSHGRVHGPGGIDSSEPTTAYSHALTASHLIGFFDVETSLTYIPKEQGVFSKTIGRPVKGGSGGAMLEPEEALFLCERGTLDLRFGRGSGSADLCSLEGLPMSLQAVYACCIGGRGLTLEQYVVYAGLKRAGYTVFRAKDDRDTKHEPPSLQFWFQNLLRNLFSRPYTPKPGQPLIGSSFFRDYATIYTRLSIIPTHTPSTLASQVPSPDHPPLKTTYHVWRPSTPIRKSNLPTPDFYICVVDARDTNFPTATQLSTLLNSIPAAIPVEKPSHTVPKSALGSASNLAPETGSLSKSGNPSTSTALPTSSSSPQSQSQPIPQPEAPKEIRPPHLYARLKNGRAGRNVILAVVDSGLVSYIRVSEGVFAEEKVWMGNVNNMRGGMKGSGRGRGNGRGRGKGRGGRG